MQSRHHSISGSATMASATLNRTMLRKVCSFALAVGFGCFAFTAAASSQTARWSLQPTASASATQDGLAESWPVNLSPQLLLQNPSEIEIDLPDGTTVTAARESWSEDSLSATWKGYVLGAPPHLSLVLLTVADNHVAGLIETEQAQYSVSPKQGGHAVERSTVSRGQCAGGVDPPRDLIGTPQALNDDLVGVEVAAGRPFVRILVLFTPNAAGDVGGGINAVAASAVAYLNTSLNNSGVSGSAQLAGAEVIGTLGGNSGLNPFLSRMQQDPTVAARRAAVEADIVQLFVGFVEATGDCGLGYVMPQGGNSRNMAAFAFGASSVRCEPSSTFAHEVGHNLGLNHNPEDSSFSRPFHSWSFGHRETSTNSKTVMSYGFQRTMPYFSNPSVTASSGFVTGVAGERDNARTLASTMSIAAGFAGNAQPPSVPAPTGLTASLASTSSALLNWTDPANDESGFRIERSVNGGGWRLATNVGANVASALIEDLPPASEIRFRVRTTRGTQSSGWSNVARVRTSAAARAPISLTATPISDTAIELSWPAASQPGSTTARLLIEGRSVNHEYLVMGELPSYSDATSGSFTVSDLDAETAYTFRTRIVEDAQTAQDIGGSASATTAGYDGPCRDDDRSLCLLEGRFEVRVAWRNQNLEGDIGVGMAVPIEGSEQSGMFWFFQRENVELIVKTLDATTITQTYWQFYGALSDVEYWVSTRDTTNGLSRTYHNPPNNLCGVGDINAFPADSDPTAPASAGLNETFSHGAHWSAAIPLSVSSTISQATEANEAGSCITDSNTLCFADNRFAVTVDFSVDIPEPATGNAVTLPAIGTEDTGFFWFFNDTNVELGIKILDGRGINDRFWLFYGALSDVEYNLTITDTSTGEVFTINNPAGTQCGGADIETLGSPLLP